MFSPCPESRLDMFKITDHVFDILGSILNDLGRILNDSGENLAR